MQNGKNWDHTVDTLVVGSGNGALTAAITAHDHQGGQVLIIEKSDKIGGTSAISGGGIWIPNSHYAKAAGAKDSIEEAKKYLRTTISVDQVSDEMIDTYLQQGPVMLKYLAENTRCEYTSLAMYPDYYATNEGGKEGHRSLEPRPLNRSKLENWRHLGESHQMMYAGPISFTQREAHGLMTGAKTAPFMFMKLMLLHRLDFGWKKQKTKYARRITVGAAGVARLLLSVQDRNIPLWRETALVDLIQEESGRVIGVKTLRQGKSFSIKAQKGVILACGGFEHNDAMREKYLPKPSSSKFSAGCGSNTGDGILATMKVGAKVDKMDHGWWVTSWNVPGEKRPRLSVIEKSLPGSIMVNRSGKRFANESENYMLFQKDLFKSHTEASPNDPAWMVFDKTYRDENIVGPLITSKQRPDHALPSRFLTPDFLTIADSIEELAEKTGIDAKGLKTTIQDFNGYTETGKDIEFQRGDAAYDRYYGREKGLPNPCLAPIGKPPFYAIRSNPGDFGTGGGLVISANAEVLSADTGNPIPGLYATGNCTAAILPTYPGPGSTLGPAMTFAFLAGKHIK